MEPAPSTARKADRKPEYVAAGEPQPGLPEGDAQPAVLQEIRKALVTSRLTLSNQSAGLDPYDSGNGRDPGSVWRRRSRY
jgi:hypothetical protein